MKKFNQIIGMFACLMALTACQEDVLVNDQQQKIYTLAGKMSGGKTMSRAQIQLNNPNSGEEIAYWNNGDSFTLYLPSDNSLVQSVFTISGDYSESGNGDKQTAVFSTENPVTANTNYVAIYPAGLPQNDKDISFEFERKLNFTDASNYNEVWSKYLQNNMYMIANGTLSADGMNTVNFEHLCAMVRITYTNSTDSEVTIDAFRLGGNNMFYDFRRNFRMSQHPGFNSGSSTSYYNVQTTGLKVAAGESTDLYILFFPSEIRENAEIGIFINANGEEKSVFMEGSKIVEANNGVTSFEAGKRYWFKVSQVTSGLIWSKDFTTEVVTIPNPYLSQALQQELGEDVVSLNEDGNAVMSLMDVRAITSLDFSWKNYVIPSLDGIEMFENLQHLYCCNTELENCDVSQNLKLRNLNVSNNYLNSLDLGNNTNLSYLRCNSNTSLQSLDLSGCPSLTTLEIINTALYDIEIPYPDRLNSFGYGGDGDWHFDLNQFTKLNALYMTNMGLTSLDIPESVKQNLRNLNIYNNRLTSIDLSEYPNLETFSCQSNELTSLDVTAVPNLRSLDCDDNRMNFLDITPLQNLSWLCCGRQKDNTTLTLKLTEAQKKEWNNNWQYNSPNVILGDEAPASDNVGGTGNDFPIEGIY